MAKQRSIAPLNRASEAFDLFKALLVPFIVDVRGEKVYFDIGDYVHLMDDEERVTRIRWIAETIVNPEEIRKGHVRSKPFREVYLNTVYESAQDIEGTPFIVGVDRRYGRLDFRTALVPTPTYLENIKKGGLLWKSA
ncbi:MAG: hypothetical protein ACE5MB_08920 [Anaerolineae bacterium]